MTYTIHPTTRRTPDMTPGSFTLRTSALRAVLPAVSTDDARPGLHYVCLEPDRTLVATNGHVMVTYRNASAGYYGSQLCLHGDGLAKALAEAGKKAEEVPCHVLSLPKAGKLLGEIRVGERVIPLGSDPFPSWQKVLLTMDDAMTGGKDGPLTSQTMNLDLLVKLARGIGKSMDGARFSRLRYTRNERAMILTTADPDYAALVMSARKTVVDEAVPSWIVREK